MKDCEHTKVYILAEELHIDDYIGQYWYNCLDCQTTGISTLTNYEKTKKKYDNTYIIYKKK